jgi:hypothetical protein
MTIALAASKGSPKLMVDGGPTLKRELEDQHIIGVRPAETAVSRVIAVPARSRGLKFSRYSCPPARLARMAFQPVTVACAAD